VRKIARHKELCLSCIGVCVCYVRKGRPFCSLSLSSPSFLSSCVCVCVVDTHWVQCVIFLFVLVIFLFFFDFLFFLLWRGGGGVQSVSLHFLITDLYIRTQLSLFLLTSFQITTDLCCRGG
jgi:hypothetical protein